MEIHEDLDEYFRILHEDPYGLENPDYNWTRENQFVAVMGTAYFLLALGMVVASSEGLIPP